LAPGNTRARTERVAEHPADVLLVGRQCAADGARFTVLQIADNAVDVYLEPAAMAARDPRGPNAASRSARHPARSAQILEACHAGGLLMARFFCAFLNRSGIRFQRCSPRSNCCATRPRLVADVSDFQDAVLTELTLDADAVILSVGCPRFGSNPPLFVNV
jgi:hypothetical protein